MSASSVASTLAQPRGASRTRHVVLTILCLLYMISYLDRTTISVAAPKIIAEFHFSKGQMGAIFSAFANRMLRFDRRRCAAAVDMCELERVDAPQVAA